MISADALPGAKGAYILFIRLDQPVAVPLGRGVTELDHGHYAYCGSARGPGGLRARVGRHLSACKKRRWHVDHLTEAGAVEAVFLVPDGDGKKPVSECELVGAMLDIRGAAIGAPGKGRGFGSSDCSHCAAHLVTLPRSLRGRAATLIKGGIWLETGKAPVKGFR